MSAFQDVDILELLDGAGMNESANLNLVPWSSLPRRAQHKNEQAYSVRHPQP